MPEKVAMLHRSMWLTVIATALEDYKRKRIGRDYFNTPDFGLVCKFADVMPEDVRKVL